MVAAGMIILNPFARRGDRFKPPLVVIWDP
jgi:hypothetical protein